VLIIIFEDRLWRLGGFRRLAIGLTETSISFFLKEKYN